MKSDQKKKPSAVAGKVSFCFVALLVGARPKTENGVTVLPDQFSPDICWSHALGSGEIRKEITSSSWSSSSSSSYRQTTSYRLSSLPWRCHLLSSRKCTTDKMGSQRFFT